MRAAKIDTFFAAGEQQGLVSKAGELLSLQRIVEKSLPAQLVQLCHVGKCADGTLTIYADNGAVAAKLKQLQETLLFRLQSRGIHSLKIRVWTQKPVELPHGSPQKMSEMGLASFMELESELPDSPLKDAVHHLLQRGK